MIKHSQLFNLRSRQSVADYATDDDDLSTYCEEVFNRKADCLTPTIAILENKVSGCTLELSNETYALLMIGGDTQSQQ